MMNPMVIKYAVAVATIIIQQFLVPETIKKVGADEWAQMTLDEKIMACSKHIKDIVAKAVDLLNKDDAENQEKDISPQ